jgi:hypothetical protein
MKIVSPLSNLFCGSIGGANKKAMHSAVRTYAQGHEIHYEMSIDQSETELCRFLRFEPGTPLRGKSPCHLLNSTLT